MVALAGATLAKFDGVIHPCACDEASVDYVPEMEIVVLGCLDEARMRYGYGYEDEGEGVRLLITHVHVYVYVCRHILCVLLVRLLRMRERDAVGWGAQPPVMLL